MLQYDLVKDEIFMGELPPVLYIYGSTKDFHELIIALLPFLKSNHYCITNYDIGIFNDKENIIIMNNEGSSGITVLENEKRISIELDRENWTDTIIALVGLSLKPCHIYSDDDDFQWLGNLVINLGDTVIFEATS